MLWCYAVGVGTIFLKPNWYCALIHARCRATTKDRAVSFSYHDFAAILGTFEYAQLKARHGIERRTTTNDEFRACWHAHRRFAGFEFRNPLN